MTVVSSPLCWNPKGGTDAQLNIVRGLRGTVHRQEVLIWNTHGGLRTENRTITKYSELIKVEKANKEKEGTGEKRGGGEG